MELIKKEVGEVFQARIDNGVPGTIFVVHDTPYEELVCEIIEKLSNKLCLVRINKVTRNEITESYEDVVIEPEHNVKPLKDRSKKELLEFAEEYNLDVNTKLKKAALLKEIKEKL